MYKPDKLENDFYVHQINAHNGKGDETCNICKAFKKKLKERNWQEARKGE